MNRLVVGLFMVLMCLPVAAQQMFNIVDPNGAPLITGDTVEVANSEPFPGYIYSDAWFNLYHEGNFLLRTHIPFSMQHFSLDPVTHQIIGYADLFVDWATWADELELEIALAQPPRQFRYYSYNSLVVEPTTVPTPSMNIIGIILLLGAVSALVMFRK